MREGDQSRRLMIEAVRDVLFCSLFSFYDQVKSPGGSSQLLGSLTAVLELIPLRRVMLIMEVLWAWSGQRQARLCLLRALDLPLHQSCMNGI